MLISVSKGFITTSYAVPIRYTVADEGNRYHTRFVRKQAVRAVLMKTCDKGVSFSLGGAPFSEDKIQGTCTSVASVIVPSQASFKTFSSIVVACARACAIISAFRIVSVAV